MAKTNDELNKLKQECEALNNKLKELNEEELEMVTGGKSPILTIQGGLLTGQIVQMVTGIELTKAVLSESGGNKEK